MCANTYTYIYMHTDKRWSASFELDTVLQRSNVVTASARKVVHGPVNGQPFNPNPCCRCMKTLHHLGSLTSYNSQDMSGVLQDFLHAPCLKKCSARNSLSWERSLGLYKLCFATLFWVDQGSSTAQHLSAEP